MQMGRTPGRSPRERLFPDSKRRHKVKTSLEINHEITQSLKLSSPL